MVLASLREDPQRFVCYYDAQVGGGGGLPGFYGTSVMYGRGLGSIFSRIFRFVKPLLKPAFSIVKPHLSAAASDLATDVFRRTVSKINSDKNDKQEGSGGLAVLVRRPKKRPPGERTVYTFEHKRALGKKKKLVAASKRRKKKRTGSSDIF